MTGRYVLKSSEAILKNYFSFRNGFAHRARFNISPGEQVPIMVLDHGLNMVDFMQWGIPLQNESGESYFWYRMNYLELEKNSIARMLLFKKQQRVIVFADGFYFWRKIGLRKFPYYVRFDAPVGFLGFYQLHKNIVPAQKMFVLLVEPFAYQTENISIPLVLKPTLYETWLNKKFKTMQEIRELCISSPIHGAKCYAVSVRVNHTRFDCQECILPLTE